MKAYLEYYFNTKITFLFSLKSIINPKLYCKLKNDVKINKSVRFLIKE